VDANAAVVYVRSIQPPYAGCTANGLEIANCFTDMASLQNWVNNIRKPKVAEPLLVDIGPGSFGSFTCGRGGITLRGSGPNHTTLVGSFSENPLGAGLYVAPVTNCFGLHVESLKVTGGFTAGAWYGGGSSTWTNVHMAGGTYGWTEQPATPLATHYWFSSRIESGSKGYTAGHSKTWFFGTEITARNSRGYIQTLESVGSGETHVYGGNLRAIADPATGTFYGSIGAITATAGEIHIHGTGIDVLAGAVPGLSASGLFAVNAFIHADAAAYNMTASGGGTIARLGTDAAGHIHAPYAWGPHDAPPAIRSLNGADTAVITNTADGHPHLAIYSQKCADTAPINTKFWLDTVTGSCI
jgi:hypothetical protein